MNDDLNKERRKQRAFDRLGTDDPHCCVCGESDWRCLESHHIAQEAYGDDAVPLCRNCHRKQRDDEIDFPASLGDSDPPLLEQIAHFLLGLAGLLIMAAERLKDYGSQLIEAAKCCPRPFGLLEGGAA
jgi:hypothetical protein